MISGHGIVRHIEVGGDASEIGTLELSRGSFILDEMTLLEEGSSSVDDISALLDEGAIVILVIDADTVQDGILEHTHVPAMRSAVCRNEKNNEEDLQVCIPKPLYGFVSVPDGA